MALRNLESMKRKAMSPTAPSTPPTPQHLTPFNSKLPPPKITFTSNWTPLNIPKSELNLPLTFPTGQTFRWRQTAPLQFTGVLPPSHLVSLKELPDGNVSYLLHHFENPNDVGSAESLEKSLLDFLNMGISLKELWGRFRVDDPRFGELADCFPGVRVLRQDPLECLIQFICSSNNNISRITKMVDYVSGLGRRLGSVGGFHFYSFPSLDTLALLSEAQLREAGFGYRAKYIIGTVKALQAKPGGGVEWLAGLRKASLEEAIVALCTLPGVGPKVAACIALFSLDQHHAIPVDTHVWQIATRHLIPELAGTRLTPKLHNRVADAFVSKYGQYAGWAQTLLFIADLPSQKAVLPSISETNSAEAAGTLKTQIEGKKKKLEKVILKK